MGTQGDDNIVGTPGNDVIIGALADLLIEMRAIRDVLKDEGEEEE